MHLQPKQGVQQIQDLPGMMRGEFRGFATSPVAGVRFVERLDALGAIHTPDCAAVIWLRPDEAPLYQWLANLSAVHLPQIREILRSDTIRSAMKRIVADMPDDPERAMFVQSISVLAEKFADVMRAPWLRLRLEVVTGDACRKFHVDNVTARLVCTYRGTGTQYGLAPRGAEPEVVDTVPTGQPIVLRGMRWPTTPPSLLKHRSPPIAGTGETRLLLVLDPILDPEDEV